MRTDPREACASEKEALFWAIVHDFLAHPAMAITLYSKWSLRFHDSTSLKAWPRVSEPEDRSFLIKSRRFGTLKARWLGGEIYSFDHPTVSHTFTTNGWDAIAALEKAEAHFSIMAAEYGGAFLSRK